MRRLRALAAILATFLLAGCGGDGSRPVDEARSVLSDLNALRPGEILIKGLRAPRLSGPYEIRRGGYLLRFRQSGSANGASRLRVSLETSPATRRPPYQLVVDTTSLSGKAAVHVDGKLYVHVHSAKPPFVLRFTPKRR